MKWQLQPGSNQLCYSRQHGGCKRHISTNIIPCGSICKKTGLSVHAWIREEISINPWFVKWYPVEVMISCNNYPMGRPRELDNSDQIFIDNDMSKLYHINIHIIFQIHYEFLIDFFWQKWYSLRSNKVDLQSLNIDSKSFPYKWWVHKIKFISHAHRGAMHLTTKFEWT